MKTTELLELYANGEMSILEFQRRLEPMLGDYEHISPNDSAFVKRVVNEIELIVHGETEENQRPAILRLYPEIRAYLRLKNLEMIVGKSSDTSE